VYRPRNKVNCIYNHNTANSDLISWTWHGLVAVHLGLLRYVDKYHYTSLRWVRKVTLVFYRCSQCTSIFGLSGVDRNTSWSPPDRDTVGLIVGLYRLDQRRLWRVLSLPTKQPQNCVAHLDVPAISGEKMTENCIIADRRTHECIHSGPKLWHIFIFEQLTNYTETSDQT